MTMEISLRLDEFLMLQAIAKANNCSLSAHMSQAIIIKHYPRQWKEGGLKNAKRIYKNLRSIGLIYIKKTNPTEWALTRDGLHVALSKGICASKGDSISG